jgi:hypothetical protein
MRKRAALSKARSSYFLIRPLGFFLNTLRLHPNLLELLLSSQTILSYLTLYRPLIAIR